MHQAKHLVLPYKLGATAGTVLLEPRPHIVGDADIQRSIPAAGEDVDVITARVAHGSANSGIGGYGSRPSPGRRSVSASQGRSISTAAQPLIGQILFRHQNKLRTT
jgi:hypothetical protein